MGAGNVPHRVGAITKDNRPGAIHALAHTKKTLRESS